MNLYKKLKDWCNANQGLLAFLALIVAIISAIPFNKIDYKIANPFFETVYKILIFNIKIPAYVFILLVSTILFYLNRLKKKYTLIPVTLNTLKGNWRCEWGEDEGSELFTLNEDGSYIIEGTHYFNLTEFDYKPNKKQITFYKTAVIPGDNRKVFNTVKVINNELLVGTEENYKIKYIKLSA